MQLDAEATQTVNLLEDFTTELNERQYQSLADSCHARVALLQGDLLSAIERSHALAESVAMPSTLFLWLEVPSITRTRVLIAEGSERSLREAIESLEAIRTISESYRFTCQTIEITALQSVALDRQGHTDKALVALDEAIVLAEPGGLIRPFVEIGSSMARLLKQASFDNISVAFVDLLLAAFPENDGNASQELAAKPTNFPINTANLPLVDLGQELPSVFQTLTNRELDTLQLLAERLYDKEIAQTLSISIWTVRTHVKHIYEKLHVSNRRQAVLKAEELGLLKKS